LRDILVDARPDQQHHDDRARWLADRYFDIVLVHADPSLARLEESFHPRRPLGVPVHYTGYVTPARAEAARGPRGVHLLVSAGGGIVGDTLFRTALAARTLMREPLPMRIIAGPFLPEPQWQALQQAARGMADVEVVRQVPDMVAEMRRARASVSQYGYNTALDIVVSGVPALVVPYATRTENEQSQRATRLANLGALRHLSAAALDPQKLAHEMDALLNFKPRAAVLKLDGAAQSAQRLHQLYTNLASTALMREAS
jgi:predicted glycosyltransferase